MLRKPPVKAANVRARLQGLMAFVLKGLTAFVLKRLTAPVLLGVALIAEPAAAAPPLPPLAGEEPGT